MVLYQLAAWSLLFATRFISLVATQTTANDAALAGSAQTFPAPTWPSDFPDPTDKPSSDAGGGVQSLKSFGAVDAALVASASSHQYDFIATWNDPVFLPKADEASAVPLDFLKNGMFAVTSGYPTPYPTTGACPCATMTEEIDCWESCQAGYCQPFTNKAQPKQTVYSCSCWEGAKRGQMATGMATAARRRR